MHRLVGAIQMQMLVENTHALEFSKRTSHQFLYCIGVGHSDVFIIFFLVVLINLLDCSFLSKLKILIHASNLRETINLDIVSLFVNSPFKFLTMLNELLYMMYYQFK